MAETKVSSSEREPEAKAPGAEERETGRRSLRDLLRSAEVDARLVGMLVALAIIWILFHFITPNHTFFSSPIHLSSPDNSLRSRSWRFVSTWNTCHVASSITSPTRAM